MTTTAAKARGENPNPADYGLSPTPAEDMLKGLRYNTATGQYERCSAYTWWHGYGWRGRNV